jgi:hypothetical protein
MTQEAYEEFEHNLTKEHNLTSTKIRKLRDRAQRPWVEQLLHT